MNTNETAHTPGPWLKQQAVSIGGLPEPAFHVRDETGKLIGTCKLGRHAFATLKEVEANTSLIAAAPDLLEALRECLGSATFHGLRGARIAIRARAAVAKAEAI